MTKFIDIHSHSINTLSDVDSWYISKKTNNPCPFFYGIHPWQAGSEVFNEAHFIEAKGNKCFIGIGEIGLDKLRPFYNKQLILFEKQIVFCIENNINIVTIHNLKATDDILKVLKKHSYKGKILLHDFNSSLQNYHQFANKYDTIISTGHRYRVNAKTRDIINQVPLKQVYFETDDEINTAISDTYIAYALSNNLHVQDLKKLIFKNFTDLQESINVNR